MTGSHASGLPAQVRLAPSGSQRLVHSVYPAGLIGLAGFVAASSVGQPGAGLAWILLASVATTWRVLRLDVVADPDGITLVGLLSTKRLGWSEMERISDGRWAFLTFTMKGGRQIRSAVTAQVIKAGRAEQRAVLATILRIGESHGVQVELSRSARLMLDDRATGHGR